MKFYVESGMKNCELVNYYAKLLKENGCDAIEFKTKDTLIYFLQPLASEVYRKKENE